MQTIKEMEKERADKMIERMQECQTHLRLLEKASNRQNDLNQDYRDRCANSLKYWLDEYQKAELELAKSAIDVSVIIIHEEKEKQG